MMFRRDTRNETPVEVDDTSIITQLHLCMTRVPQGESRRWIQLDATVQNGQTAPVFHYEQGTLGFGDELIGMTLFGARELMRKRDIAYCLNLLNSVAE